MRNHEVIAVRTQPIERGEVLVAAEQLLDGFGRQDIAVPLHALAAGRRPGVHSRMASAQCAVAVMNDAIVVIGSCAQFLGGGLYKNSPMRIRLPFLVV